MASLNLHGPKINLHDVMLFGNHADGLECLNEVDIVRPWSETSKSVLKTRLFVRPVLAPQGLHIRLHCKVES